MAAKTRLQSAGDGSAIPVGYFGELATGTVSTPTLTSGTVASVANITLQPGTWEIHGHAYFIPQVSTTVSYARATINTSIALDPIHYNSYGQTSLGGIEFVIQIYRRVTITSATQYFLNVACGFSGGTCATTSSTYLTATRIA